MPLVDMPLEQLREYSGRNPKPTDFEDYWVRALAEMHAVDPQPLLEPAEFRHPGVETFHLWFTGVNGSRIHALYLRPNRRSGPLPAVLQFHGYSGSAGNWTDKVAYAASGFCLAAMDVRGQGGRSQDLGNVTGNTLRGHIIRGLDDEPDKLFFRNVFLDTAQLARVVMGFDEVDADRVGAFGGSQGGGLTLACAALCPQIKRAAPEFPFLCDYQRVWEMDLADRAYLELNEYFKKFDPLHERQTDFFTRLGYIDLQHLAPRIRATVMMATGLMDQVCPPSTQFAAYNKITSEKSVVIYPDFGHEGLPGFADRAFQFFLDL